MNVLASLQRVWTTITDRWTARSASRAKQPEAIASVLPQRLTSQAAWGKLSRVIDEAVQRADLIQNAQRASALQLDAAELALRRLLAEARHVVRQPIVMFEAVPVTSGQYRMHGTALAA